MKIIGLAGLARSGKDSDAQHLVSGMGSTSLPLRIPCGICWSLDWELILII